MPFTIYAAMNGELSDTHLHIATGCHQEGKVATTGQATQRHVNETVYMYVYVS